MSYSKYYEFINGSNLADFNSIHIKVDHSQLDPDPQNALNQLSTINSRIAVFYYDTTTINLVSKALDQVDDMINQMRLFLIYFALPGLLLGGFLSKYAIDLSVKERGREIGLLRTKAAQRKQIALSVAFESTIISLIGLGVGILAGYAISLSISNILNDTKWSFIEVSTVSVIISLSVGVLIAISAAFLSTRQLLIKKPLRL